MGATFVNEEALGQVVSLIGEERQKVLDFVNEALKKAKEDDDREMDKMKSKAEEAEKATADARKKADELGQECDKAKKKADDLEKECDLTKKQAEDDGKKKDDMVKAEIKEAKTALAEKVNNFLTNLVPRIKGIVEEELRLSPENITAESVVEKIRKAMGVTMPLPSSNVTESLGTPAPAPTNGNNAADTAIVGELESQVKELTENVATLNERITRKENILSEREGEVEKLKGMLKAWELCSEDPDRDYIMKQLAECKNEDEVTEQFAELKKKLRRDAETDLIEQFNDPVSEGPGVTAPANNDSRLDESPLSDNEKHRLAELAGIAR